MDNRLYYLSGALYCAVHEDRKEYFYEDGSFKTIETYRNGKLDGEAVLYWPNGNLKRKCGFIQGIRHGLDQIWNEEGQIISEDRYEMGKHV